jgi:SPOR domain
MIDHKFDTFRSRDPDARQERGQAARRRTGDSLAELARLIGQGANGGRHNTHSPERSADGGFPGLNWAAGKAYPEQRQQGEVVPRRAHQSESYIAVPQERSNEKEPPPGRYFSGPADKFNGFHEDGEHPAAVDNVQYRDDRQPVSLGGDRRPPVFPSDQVPTFLLTASDGRHDADTEPAESGEVYGADDYYVDVPDPRRRDGLIVVAVLALAVLGTAGTFAYRATFGGSAALPTASAVIKTGNWPNKIVSNYGDDRRSDSNQTPMAIADPSEELVLREEKPLDIQGPQKTAPRVISTIPISPNSSAPSLGTLGSAAVAPLGPAPAPAVAPPEPTAESVPLVAAAGAPGLPELKKIHTVTIRSDWPDSVGDAPATPMAESVSPLAPAPVPASGSPEPKKIHTVTIRSDGSGRTNTSVAARNATSERRPSAAAAPPVANQPMSPTPRDSVRSRMTVGTGTAAEASSRGGYVVQVASESNAADAHTVFRTLQTKFPKQLGKREPIVRRTDLGAKGIYYRTIVGPFASMEDATRMCSTLKAAGGSCLVQRN